MTARARSPVVDVLFDRRCTSHMSVGMTLYVRKLIEFVPRIAPDLRVVLTGDGDNFDLSEQIGLPRTIARTRPRLTHIPTPFVPVVVPSRFILTIHDLIELQYPHFAKRTVGPYYRLVVGPVARRACAVITDDRATVGELKRLLGVDPGRVRVVPLGVDLAAATAAPALGRRPFFLYVGNHRPHKNVATLVRAWSMLPEALAADLYLTGNAAAGTVLVNGHARTNGRVVFVGNCDDGELAALYRAARAYVHPALAEGFGLPMLEAMRSGTPVIAARAALPDILAPHAQAFEATDAGALCELMTRALTQPDALRTSAGAAQTATRALTWERTARATVEIYREFLA